MKTFWIASFECLFTAGFYIRQNVVLSSSSQNRMHRVSKVPICVKNAEILCAAEIILRRRIRLEEKVSAIQQVGCDRPYWA